VDEDTKTRRPLANRPCPDQWPSHQPGFLNGGGGEPPASGGKGAGVKRYWAIFAIFQ